MIKVNFAGTITNNNASGRIVLEGKNAAGQSSVVADVAAGQTSSFSADVLPGGSIKVKQASGSWSCSGTATVYAGARVAAIYDAANAAPIELAAADASAVIGSGPFALSAQDDALALTVA